MTDLLEGINQTFLDENVLGLYNNQANLLRLYNELITEEKSADNRLDNLIKKSIYKYCFQRAMYYVGMNNMNNTISIEDQVKEVVNYIYPDTENNEFIKDIYSTFYDYLRMLFLFLHNISSQNINFQDISRILNLNFTTMLNNNVIGYYCIMWLYLGSLLGEQQDIIFNITLENYNTIIRNKDNFKERERRIFLLSFLYSPFDYEIIYYYCKNVYDISIIFETYGGGRGLTSIIMGSYLNDNIMKRENVNETYGCFFFGNDEKSNYFYDQGYLFLIPNRFKSMSEDSESLSYLLRLIFSASEQYKSNILLFYTYSLLNEYYDTGNFSFIDNKMQIEDDTIEKESKNNLIKEIISNNLGEFYDDYKASILPIFNEKCTSNIIEIEFIDKENSITISGISLLNYYETIAQKGLSYKLLNTGFFFLREGGTIETAEKGQVIIEPIKDFITAIGKYYKSTSNMTEQIKLLEEYTKKL